MAGTHEDRGIKPRVLDSFELREGGAHEQRIARAAGFPPEATPWIVTSTTFVPAGHWIGFRLEVVAVRVDEQPDASETGWMMGEIIVAEGPLETWHLRFARARIYYCQAPAYLQVRWRNGRRQRMTLGGDLDELTRHDGEQLLRGRELLHRVVDRPGRPPDDGVSFKQKLCDAWLRRYAQTRRRPAQDDIADDLGLGRRHFRRQRRRFLGVDWKDYRPLASTLSPLQDHA